MASIDEDCELNRSRSSKIGEGVERCSHGPSGEEDIIDEEDNATFYVDGNLRRRFGHHGSQVKVVAVERNVERTFWDLGTGDAFELEGEPVGQGHTAALETDDDDSVKGTMAFDDFMRHSGEGSADAVSTQNFANSSRWLRSRCHSIRFTVRHCSPRRSGLTGPASRPLQTSSATAHPARLTQLVEPSSPRSRGGR